MKLTIPILLAFLVGVGTIPYVYGFKKAFSENPFLYAGICNLFCGITLLVFGCIYGISETQYLTNNWMPLGMSVIGIVIGNISNYFIITRFGASFWLLASLSMLLIPSFVVGYLIFKESFNFWIVPSVVCALLTVVFFGLSKR